jgi:hypothetical protein
MPLVLATTTASAPTTSAVDAFELFLGKITHGVFPPDRPHTDDRPSVLRVAAARKIAFEWEILMFFR